MVRRVLAGAAIIVAGCAGGGGVEEHLVLPNATTGVEREYPLAPGDLQVWPGILVGLMRERHNDIYSLQCAPLLEGERVLAWVNRLHIAGDRIFVDPCVESLFSSGESYWTFGDAWYEADVDGEMGSRQLHLSRISFDEWDGHFNNSVPCGSLVAWWSLGRTPDGVGALLRARVGSLATGEVLGRDSLGVGRLDTDNPGALQIPVWNATCTSVRFDGDRYGLDSVTIEVPR